MCIYIFVTLSKIRTVYICCEHNISYVFYMYADLHLLIRTLLIYLLDSSNFGLKHKINTI